MKLRTAAALSFTLLLASPAAAVVSEHPDFTENRDRPMRLVLLPVQSSITRGRVTDTESLVKETKALEQALTREAAAAIRSLGYEIDTEIVAAEALATDESLLAVADEARDRAFESLAEASRDPKGVARGRFTIDDAALPLAAHAQADGLLVLSSQSFIVSKGSKTLSAIFNPLNLAAATRTRTQVIGGIFDMRDGQLLALLVGRDVGPVLKKPGEVARQVIGSTFRDYPRAGVGSAARPKHRKAAPPRDLKPVSPADAERTQDALAAFEEAAAAHEAPVDRDSPPAADPVPDPVPDPEPEPAMTEDDADLIRRLFDLAPDERSAPSLQVVSFGDEGDTALLVRNMTPEPVRVSVNRETFFVLARGQAELLRLKPGSHRLLVVHPEEDRELVRAALIVREGRESIAELWPRND